MGNKSNKLSKDKFLCIYPSRQSSRQSSLPLIFSHGNRLDLPSAAAAGRNKSSNDPPIFKAVDENDIEKVKRMIKRGCNINKVDLNGLTPLHCAALNGSEECVKMLIQAKCRLMPCQLRLTSLHFAAQNGNPNIINMLIDYGEIVNQSDAMGDTPLSAAVQMNNIEAAKVLLKRGARLKPHIVVIAFENGFNHLLRELINHNPVIIDSINLSRFIFTEKCVESLKIMFYAGFKFPENFIEEIRPIDWFEFCMDYQIRLPESIYPSSYNRDHEFSSFVQFSQWFQQQNEKNVMSLKCLSRIAFRGACGSNQIENILLNHFVLPKSIIDYLLLKVL